MSQNLLDLQGVTLLIVTMDLKVTVNSFLLCFGVPAALTLRYRSLKCSIVQLKSEDLNKQNIFFLYCETSAAKNLVYLKAAADDKLKSIEVIVYLVGQRLEGPYLG